MKKEKEKREYKEKVLALSRDLLLQKCEEINEEIVDACVDIAKRLVDRIEKL